MAILEVRNLEKSFGSTQVLKDISFSLEKGQALSIIGSSGSGKTTLLRCLNFLEKPNSGTISINNNVIFDASNPATQLEKETAKSVCTLVWCSRTSTSSPSTRRCRMSLWPGS